MPWRWAWNITGPRLLRASSRTRPRGTRDTARARVSAPSTLSTAWDTWRQRRVLRLSLRREPVPAAQDGVGAVVEAAFPAAGLAAVAAERSKELPKSRNCQIVQDYFLRFLSSSALQGFCASFDNPADNPARQSCPSPSRSSRILLIACKHPG